MTSIPITDLLTIIFVLVDDCYQAHGYQLLSGKVGRKPAFKASEVITLMLAHDFIPYPGETQSVEFIRANYLSLFPKLVTQSQFDWLSTSLTLSGRVLTRVLDRPERLALAVRLLLDTKPIPVVGYKRWKDHRDFAGQADEDAVPAETSSPLATNW